jgi:glycerophosphoryl diester phosphodiesterase
VSRPLIIAHRGASGYAVENSLSAFRAAAERGADAVELDVHTTADGALVVHHGEKVGEHFIAHSSLPEVRSHLLANGECLPTLDEALSVIVPGMIAFVEIKGVPPRHDETLFAAIERTGAPEKVAVHGFDHRIIHRIGEKRPHLRRGVLFASYPMHPVRCLEGADASILWQHRMYVDEALVVAIHGAGMALHVYTLNDPEEIRGMVSLGVDGICTDFPDVARAVTESLPQDR